eukprot:TRINITY_DN78377_c0_g1_i1.p1 TRINITY_DN78377_c0_g1~~TRINITY_DN78377_c0_g1_i1.p1  ORF type:complete len:353 (+),score=59.92 TRINITY_DN78377_c0_g1_i1:135-1061(+)
MDQNTFVQVFQQYGQIASAKLCPPKVPGARSSGLIRFQSQAEATWVVDTLHGNIAMGLTDPIVCNYANERGPSIAGITGIKGGALPAITAFGGCDGGKAKGKGAGNWGEIASLVAQMTGKGGGDSYDGGDSSRSQPYNSKGGGKALGKVGAKGCGKTDPLCDAVYMTVKNAGLIGAGRPPPECELYVGNIPSDSHDLFLYRLFSPFGAIAHTGAKAMINPDGTCKGFAFVDFVDPGAAQTAVATLNGMTLPDGNNLIVCLKAESKQHYQKTGGARGGGGKGKGGYDDGWGGGFGDGYGGGGGDFSMLK